MDEEIKTVKKRPIALIVALGVGGLAILVGMTIYQVKNSDKFVNYNMVLKITANGINLTCPKMIRDGVRLDSVGAKFDRQLWYYYTFTEINRDEEINEDYCKTQEKLILQNLSANPEVKEFGKNNVTIVFNLYDKNHLTMCSVQVPPGKYYTPQKN